MMLRSLLTFFSIIWRAAALGDMVASSSLFASAVGSSAAAGLMMKACTSSRHPITIKAPASPIKPRAIQVS